MPPVAREVRIEDEPATNTPSDLVRWIAYAHLVAVALAAAFTLADRGILVDVSVSRLYLTCCVPLLFYAIGSLYVLPFLMLLAVVSGRLGVQGALMGSVVETLLTFAHVFVLLPSVQ